MAQIVYLLLTSLFLFPNQSRYFCCLNISVSMTNKQQLKIKELISKYNAILLNSMRIAIAEDFINLVILNRDDSKIELAELLNNKNEYYNYILKEFLKQNSSSVLDELKLMDDPTAELIRKFTKKTDELNRTIIPLNKDIILK